jgi:hypothetical protein
MFEPGVRDGWAETPPGPGLSAALGTLDLPRVPSGQVVEVLRAQSRQSAHEQARLWATLLEVGLAIPADDSDAGQGTDGRLRACAVSEWAIGEVAAALTWTDRAAYRELGLADVVVRALPAVFAALWDGRIDRGKAVVFADYLDPAYGVTAAQTKAILARILPVAPRLTTAQLRGRLWRAVVAVDPGWARRRYTRAVRGRAVTAVLAEDGTVTVTGSGLPADEAATACARVDRLAEAAKRAGHPGRRGQIAADVFLGLLDGRFHDRSEEQIIAALLRDPRPEDTPDDTPTAPDTAENPPAENTAGEDTDDAAETTGARTSDPDTAEAAGSDDPDPAADAAPAPAAPAPAPANGGANAGVPGRTGIEIRVGLATLLGLDEQPGEIPGLGPVLADVARTAVARQVRGAEWRFAITDPDGYLLLAGVTRRRPRSLPAPDEGSASRGGIVELQVPATQLRQLVAHDRVAPDWAGVIADIAAQFARRDELLAALDNRPSDRFPHAARHIQVRDRTCSHPGCRRPARRCDLDHTHDHAHGGPTVTANIGPGCDRHHVYKHELGWQLTQPQPGIFEWISPLGQVYRTRGEPITPPLPQPLPRPEEPDPPDGYARCEGPILHLPPPEPPTEARPPPLPGDPDEPPPF